jgi:hypothetical protein
MHKAALLFLYLLITTSFTAGPGVKHNGCYKSVSPDHTLTGMYYIRLYPDGTAIEYEQSKLVKISFDKRMLGTIMHKGRTNEKFPLKTGQYYIKDSAIKITLNGSNETVTYEGTIAKFSLKVQRHDTKTNTRTDLELSFLKIKNLR